MGCCAVHLSHIIYVLVIPIRVSDVLGYARNNSECLIMVGITPPTDGKSTTNVWNGKEIWK